MALKATLELPNPASGATIEGRRQTRRALKLHTSGVSQGGAPANVTIHNLSAAGLLIETELELVPGDRLAIGLPDTGPVGAEIVWVSERLYGCAFEQALGEAELVASERQARQARQAGLAGLAGQAGRAGQAGLGERIATGKTPLLAPSMQSSFPGSAFGGQLGPRLNRLRRERSLTLDQVASALGVSKPTVWAWEKGKARPLPERIAGIAQVLDVPEAELTGALEEQASASLIEDCRVRIASEYRISPEAVRIMIEV